MLLLLLLNQYLPAARQAQPALLRPLLSHFYQEQSRYLPKKTLLPELLKYIILFPDVFPLQPSTGNQQPPTMLGRSFKLAALLDGSACDGLAPAAAGATLLAALIEVLPMPTKAAVCIAVVTNSTAIRTTASNSFLSIFISPRLFSCLKFLHYSFYSRPRIPQCIPAGHLAVNLLIGI